AEVIRPEAPVGFETDTLKNSPSEPSVTDILTAFTSLAVLLTAVTKSQSPVRGQAHVSRQSLNPRRRKRTPQGPRGGQARDRGEVRRVILDQELRRGGCSTVLIRGDGTDRTDDS